MTTTPLAEPLCHIGFTLGQPSMPPMVRLTDGLLDAIEATVASVAPERGGALLGVGALTHLFLADTHGVYSRASWDISAGLTTAIGMLEAAGRGVLTGTVHSHPREIPDPSSTDVKTTTLALRMNPHLDRLLIAVVTEGAPRRFDVAVGSRHRMSVHVLAREGATGATYARARIEVVPLLADLRSAGLSFCSLTGVDDWVQTADDAARVAPHTAVPHIVPVDGRLRIVVPLADRPHALLFDDRYPIAGPMRLQVDHGGGNDLPVSHTGLPWHPQSSARMQLADLVEGPAAIQGAVDRVADLVGSLATKSVLVAGLGSVGSRIADELVRAGVGAVTLVDPDTVAAPNLARSVYRVSDLGRAKAFALAGHLHAINPVVSVNVRPVAISDLVLPDELDGIDLIIAATDDMQQQALLAHHAYASNVTLVACALYRKAAAGEVVLQVPSADTACWSCAVGMGTAAASRRPDTDYGAAGRLAGESALGPSIAVVTSVAAQIALGLLAGPDSPAGRPLAPALSQRRTLGLVSTTPGWDFFPTVFAGMAHQYAPQSLWPVVVPNPACPACGDHRQAPLSLEQGDAVAQGLQQLIDDEASAATPQPTGSVAVKPVKRQANPALTLTPIVLAGLFAATGWVLRRRRKAITRLATELARI